MWTIILFLAALLVIYYTIWINKWGNPECEGVLPPDSMGIPIIGETLQLFIPSNSLDIHTIHQEENAEMWYGPIFRSSVAGRPAVISTDQELNHYILTQEGRTVQLWYLGTFSKIFALDGESRTHPFGYIHRYSRGAILSQIGFRKPQGKTASSPQMESMVTETLHS
ncbi:cucurbitadienol 11-hydroxylase [Ricinus communis]|uniref:cucurbitadienol 11-hydroxylase n=1 Tax=Ricinus communis TaxID=3988 RepID=UPI0007727BDF|nr:cucurbitadienol 11-hydroxylase [Ricinus communis]|eukprot:XP_015580046.1 cytochrome P450 87A3 [Ricinus communis]